jgi:hypothetical protein
MAANFAKLLRVGPAQIETGCCLAAAIITAKTINILGTGVGGGIDSRTGRHLTAVDVLFRPRGRSLGPVHRHRRFQPFPAPFAGEHRLLVRA